MNKSVLSVILISSLFLVACSQSTDSAVESSNTELTTQKTSIEATAETSNTETSNTETVETSRVNDSKKNYVNLSEEYVIECLQNVELIEDIEAATENHDPNHHLGKQGGYTAAIYFTISLIEVEETDSGRIVAIVNDEEIPILLHDNESIDSPVDLGTECGGQIEVYATIDDAAKRDEYLSNFDGGPLAVASHYVFGSMIIRVSNHLTASQQKELTNAIIEALKNG